MNSDHQNINLTILISGITAVSFFITEELFNGKIFPWVILTAAILGIPSALVFNYFKKRIEEERALRKVSLLIVAVLVGIMILCILISRG